MEHEPELEIVLNLEDGIKNFYDEIAQKAENYSFLSPLILDGWTEEVCEWMGQGESVLEIGFAQGKLINLCLIEPRKIKRYYGVDISREMLRKLRETVSIVHPSIELKCYLASAESDNLAVITKGEKMDRIIAINVFQDLEIHRTLTNIVPVLKNGGLIRATFIRKETHDIIFGNDINYNMHSGIYYTFSRFHDEMGTSPLGYIHTPNGKIPFYRRQKFYALSEVLEAFNQAGLRVLEAKTLSFPLPIIFERWASKYHRVELSSVQLSLLQEWNGFPDLYDVIAMLPD
jgi:ubiquinone/menaquinone biosynthesis C-methylase UbiE